MWWVTKIIQNMSKHRSEHNFKKREKIRASSASHICDRCVQI
jgi:hypothetical protein